MLMGYMHPGYAESLQEFGILRELPHCGGWVLVRHISDFPYYDAMGCYPLFACPDWSQLHVDLESLKDELICLSLVTEPFGEFNLAYLQKHFDVVLPFKEHFVSDLHLPINQIVSKKHRYNARKALRIVEVEHCIEPINYLDEWWALYQNLIERHSIKGIRTFSQMAFSKQLQVPGMHMFRALHQGITVGINLIYVMERTAYTHLSAFSSIGYDLKASYAIRLAVIEYLVGKADWLDLGGSSGINKDDIVDGLGEFKKGWSTGTRTAYFCGRIFDREKYYEIAKAKNVVKTNYFPAYRQGEFN